MCRAVKCDKCHKTAWAGCGQHVDEVLRGVPSSQRCLGHARESRSARGIFAKLFGR
ncbi:UNVERIFIED_ORG: hypothetical protein ABIB21_001875 [Arthrobacter sp. UYEF13]